MRKSNKPAYERAIQIRNEHQELQADFWEGVYLSAEATVINAKTFESEKQEWVKFCKDAFWKGCKNPPQSDDQSQPLRHLLWFNYGKGDNTRKRAWRHAKLLNYLLGVGIEPHQIFDELVAYGGWSGVERAQAEADEDAKPPEKDNLSGQSGTHSPKVRESKNAKKTAKKEVVSETKSEPPPRSGVHSNDQVGVTILFDQEDAEALRKLRVGEQTAIWLECRKSQQGSISFNAIACSALD